MSSREIQGAQGLGANWASRPAEAMHMKRSPKRSLQATLGESESPLENGDQLIIQI